MSIFNFENFPSRKKRKSFLIFALFSIGLLTIGSTLAVRLTVNTNGAAEFGQGILRTTSCDSNGIKVTPVNSFLNQTKAGFFTFNAIQLQHISSDCQGMDFIIKVYDKTGEPISISTENGQEVKEVRVFFQTFSDSIPMSQNDNNSNSVSIEGYWPDQFTLVGNSPIVVGTLSNLFEKPGSNIDLTKPASTYFELDKNENAFQVSFNPSSEIKTGFADSKNVYRITLESVVHQS